MVRGQDRSWGAWESWPPHLQGGLGGGALGDGGQVVVGHEEGLHAGVHVHPHMRLELRGQREEGRGFRLTAAQRLALSTQSSCSPPGQVELLLSLGVAHVMQH